MSTRKKSEVVSEPESDPPVSAPRRRSTKPWFVSSRPPAGRTQTQPGLSLPPPEPPASERVWKAAGLGPRPVRSPR
jgi:hypothetical protein